MKEFREWIINLIYKGATGTKRIRMILTPLVGFIFFCIVLLLILISFYSICSKSLLILSREQENEGLSILRTFITSRSYIIYIFILILF